MIWLTDFNKDKYHDKRGDRANGEVQSFNYCTKHHYYHSQRHQHGGDGNFFRFLYTVSIHNLQARNKVAAKAFAKAVHANKV